MQTTGCARYKAVGSVIRQPFLREWGLALPVTSSLMHEITIIAKHSGCGFSDEFSFESTQIPTFSSVTKVKIFKWCLEKYSAAYAMGVATGLKSSFLSNCASWLYPVNKILLYREHAVSPSTILSMVLSCLCCLLFICGQSDFICSLVVPKGM